MTIRPQPGQGEIRTPANVSQGLWFPGRQYPDILEFGRDYDHLLDVRFTDLSVLVEPGPPPRYRTITETLGIGGPDNRWTTVAEIQVPPNFKPATVVIETALNDPALALLGTPPNPATDPPTPFIPAVSFKLAIDNNEVGKPWGASANYPIHFGVMSRTANGARVRVLAYVSSALWSSPAGATPIRSLIQAYCSLQVVAVMDKIKGDKL